VHLLDSPIIIASFPLFVKGSFGKKLFFIRLLS